MNLSIDIHSDTICPWCYIGKRRLEAALADDGETGAEIRWRPFQLNPEMPREGIGRADYLAIKFGGPEHARQAYAAVAHAAEATGLEMDLEGIRRTPNTLQSHRLLAHAARAGSQDAVVEGLFRAYFVEGRDIGDDAVLADVAGRAGLDPDDAARHLAGDAGREEVLAEDRAARAAGIHGVPHLVIDGALAVSGAQEPAVFRQVFAVARSRRRDAA